MIVAVSGYKRSGKDTVGNILCDKHNFKKAPPFAIFKKAIAEWFGWDDRHLNGELKEVVDEKWGFSPRQIMQVFGTELMKEELGKLIPQYKETVGNSIWAKVFCEWYEKQDKNQKFVVTDLRFPEEQEELKKFDDVFFVRVYRNIPHTDMHMSENKINDIIFDYFINNDGTIKELEREIDNLFFKLDTKKFD